MIDFSGKTALVTGAGGTIGRATAQLFNRLGAELVLTDLNTEALREILSNLPCASGGLSRVVVADQIDLIERIPMRRLGAAADVAQAIAFLSSDAASYISGQVLRVNGGLYAPG